MATIANIDDPGAPGNNPPKALTKTYLFSVFSVANLSFSLFTFCFSLFILPISPSLYYSRESCTNIPFYAKQTQFAQCSNKRKYCCNKGLAKYLTLPKPAKQTQFQPHHLRSACATTKMQNKPNFARTRIHLTSYRHKYYEKMPVREPRKNKPNFPIEDRTLSPLVAGTPPIKPVSASLKVTKNAKKTLVLWYFGDVSTCFPLFVTRLREFRTRTCAFLSKRAPNPRQAERSEVPARRETAQPSTIVQNKPNFNSPIEDRSLSRLVASAPAIRVKLSEAKARLVGISDLDIRISCFNPTIMQNKPNFQNAKINLTTYRDKIYEKMSVREPRKNKPNFEHTPCRHMENTV